MSKLEVNTIAPQSGTTVTLGESGDTVALGSGVTGSGLSAADNYFATSGLSNKDLGTGLHIKTGDSGASVDSTSDELVIENNGYAGMTILSSTSTEGGIKFGNSVDNDAGRIVYDHNADNMFFMTGGSERFRIDDNGVVKVTSRTYVDGQIDTIAKINVMFGGNAENGMQFSDKDGATSGKFIGFSRNGTSPASQGTQIGTITRNGSSDAVSYNTSSDYRLKDGIVDKTDGIEKLKQLQPRKFYWKSDEDQTLVDGFLAHEVSDIVPEAINGVKDAVDSEGNPIYQGIDQAKLVPLLTSALQEAITKIETLEAENTDIKARLTALENA